MLPVAVTVDKVGVDSVGSVGGCELELDDGTSELPVEDDDKVVEVPSVGSDVVWLIEDEVGSTVVLVTDTDVSVDIEDD